MSSFFHQIIQWKGGRRGPLKLALFFWHGSVVTLGWFTVPCICVINYFSLYAKGIVWGSLPLRLCGYWCGHSRWQKNASPERYIILQDAAAWGGVWISSEVRLPAGRNESLSGQCSLYMYWGLYLLAYLIVVTNSHVFHNWELLYYITRKK